MLKKIKKSLKKTASSIAILASLTGCLTLPPSSKLSLKKGYNFENKSFTMRTEGATKLTNNLGLYGYIDLDGSEEKPVSLKEKTYFEVLANYTFGKGNPKKDNFGIAAEFSNGSDLESTFRYGLTYGTLRGNNFTMLKYFPFDSHGNKSQQISVNSTQKINGKISANLSIDYNFNKGEKNTVRPEFGLDYKLNNKASAYFKARKFSGAKDSDWSFILGLKYDF